MTKYNTIQPVEMKKIHDFSGDGDSSNNGSGGGSNSGGSGNNNPFSGSNPLGQSPFGPTSTDVGIEDLPLINYNEKAEKKEFNQALFRDEEIERTVGILSMVGKPNALLVGDAGVGKTQIVEEIANRIVAKDPIVSRMLDSTIYELQISSLVAGKSLVGQLEDALNDIIDFASDPDNKAILFIDEIHQLLSASDPTSQKIAQILKPALGRSGLRIIGATTTSEATSFLNDPAFNRRFSRNIIPELNHQQTIQIMYNVRNKLQDHHNVLLPDEIINQSVILGDEYRQTGSHRPDSTITLVDRAMAQARIKRLHLENKGESDPNIKNFLAHQPKPLLTIQDLKVSGMDLVSGSSETPANQIKSLTDRLNSQIVGQDVAKEQLLDSIKRQHLNLVRQTKPISFLFAGLTGTGKTEIAKQLSQALYGESEGFIYINMSEYSNSSSLTRITGSSAGYIGSDSNRELPFDSLQSKPYQVILLDEFEKAHVSVQRFFMQALDTGEVQDNRNTIIDFTRTIVIATTNAGVEELSTRNIGFNSGKTLAETADSNDLIQALKGSFDVELLNRFEHLISFGPMSEEDYMKILAVKYNNIIKEASENRQDVTFEPQQIDLDKASEYEFIQELKDSSYEPELNGRPAERTMKAYIQDQMLENSNNTVFEFQ